MKLRSESQQRMVARHLQEGKSITPLEALTMYGAFRLSAIIFDLKNEEGMDIRTDMVTDDEGRRYAKYTLNQK
jgi:hypothetical protein